MKVPGPINPSEKSEIGIKKLAGPAPPSLQDTPGNLSEKDYKPPIQSGFQRQQNFDTFFKCNRAKECLIEKFGCQIGPPESEGFQG